MGAEGRIIVIVAPSGTGKSVLIRRLKRDLPALRESVSHTTRRRRRGERDGVQYFFVERDEFGRMRDGGAFLEWAEVHGNLYGTSRDFVERELARGSPLLLDLDVQGARALKGVFGGRASTVFVAPPSLAELEARLRKRGTETPESLRVRLENARRELPLRDRFDHSLVNDDLDRAYLELRGVVGGILGEPVVRRA